MFFCNQYDGSGMETSEMCFLYYVTLTRILTWKGIYNTSYCKNFGFEQNIFWSIFMRERVLFIYQVTRKAQKNRHSAKPYLSLS